MFSNLCIYEFVGVGVVQNLDQFISQNLLFGASLNLGLKI